MNLLCMCLYVFVCACDVMTTISFCPKEVKIDAVTARGSGWLVDFPSPPSPNNPHLDLDLDLSSPSHLQFKPSSSPLVTHIIGDRLIGQLQLVSSIV